MLDIELGNYVLNGDGYYSIEDVGEGSRVISVSLLVSSLLYDTQTD